MNRQLIVSIDNAFYPLYWFLSGLKKVTPKKQVSSSEYVIFKFFGMGSITRLAHVIENSDAHSSITLVTLKRNKGIAELLNLSAIYIEDKNASILIVNLVKKIITFWRMKNVVLVDMERSSNLAAAYSLVCSIRKNYASFNLSDHTIRKKGYLSVGLENKPGTSAIAEILDLTYSENTQKDPARKSIEKIGVNINAGDYLPERRLDEQKWIDIVCNLTQIYPTATFYLTGDHTEKERVSGFHKKLENVCDSHRIINVAGHYSLSEFTDKLKELDLFLTNDSGPLHLARFLNVKTVAFWGPTSERLVGYPDSKIMLNLFIDLPCRPCFKNPKSKVAQACGGKATCFSDMSAKALVQQIKTFG